MTHRYTVKPWRGFQTGHVYYDIMRGWYMPTKVLTCFTEQEANDMIAKLNCWDQGKPTQVATSAEGTKTDE